MNSRKWRAARGAKASALPYRPARRPYIRADLDLVALRDPIIREGRQPHG